MIPTEPIGSIPRPPRLIAAMAQARHDAPELDPLDDETVRDTIERFEATGSPVVTDGEQRKYHNFWTYGVEGLPNTAPDGFTIPFAAGHTRRMPRLTAGPFRYRRYADSFLDLARRYAHAPLKKAVISPSALSLMYPAEGIAGHSRDAFLEDLLREDESEIRRCLAKGADVVVDFTEGRLTVKIDPSGHLLAAFVDLNDRDSTHSADIDYADLLPSLFELKADNFYIALVGETDRSRVLTIIRRHMKPEHSIFVGVVAPIDPHIETREEVCDRILEAARYISVDQLGTTDDCGFAPFSDDISTTRDTAFAKIGARVRGTILASRRLGVDL